MLSFKLFENYLRTLEAIRVGVTARDKFLILLNRILHVSYPLNTFWYDMFGRSLLDPRSIIHGYRCKYHNSVFFCPGGNSEIQFLDWWEPAVKSLVTAMTYGDAVDVGSNLGLYTVMLSQSSMENRRIISIEPNPNYFGWLKKNVELNNCRNVTPLNIAAWSSTTKLELSHHVFGGLPIDSSISSQTKATFTVDARPLDDVVRELRTKPRLIKVDVEGAELDVLHGAQETIRSLKPVLIFEALSNEAAEKCRAFLAGLGYRVKSLPDGNFSAIFG